MPSVKFTSTDEFLLELRRDVAAVERKIIRITCRYRSEYPMTGVAVLASFVVADRVVSLESRCGSYLFDTDQGEVKTRAEERLSLLTKAAEELGLEVRSGSYE
jgi:hypothetical protein